MVLVAHDENKNLSMDQKLQPMRRAADSGHDLNIPLAFGDEAVHPIEFLFSKPPDAELAAHEYTQNLDETFREAHLAACETINAAQIKQKNRFLKKTFENRIRKTTRWGSLLLS